MKIINRPNLNITKTKFGYKAPGTAFVKYRQQLSPKYFQEYKEKERIRREKDQQLEYKQYKGDAQIDTRISGVNCRRHYLKFYRYHPYKVNG